ncbi:hypothetical protein IM792_14705 [Mucilaginibacter sp. JRF]|uniref:KAP family P-loop NTPase fold protein n=1 Tax=Mucilaginibacter sp. JRF TaxID=2780088 RepID=UPI00188119C9|nr:P-loop NTPase fold protein [Mucilaginibacter sp. JRF]MBE9585704.1 hypothetical protein [Mucilaginibacter sp. JRF]
MDYEYVYYGNGFSFYDNFIKGIGDLIVVPHNTEGKLASSYVDFVDEFNLFDYIPGKSQIGDLKLINLQEDRKYVLFACVEATKGTTYGAIRLVALKIAELMVTDKPLSAVIPNFGGKDQYESAVYTRIILKAFGEGNLRNIRTNFISKYHQVYSELEPDFENAESSARIALRFSLPKIVNYEWVKDLIDSNTFYHQLAVEKFKEFKSATDNGNGFYHSLEQEFHHSGLVFQEFIRKFDEKTEQYKVLRLCGELIAYCDRNAYKKKEWNLNKDFRTLAQSGVKQTQWVSNLLRYKATKNSLDVLSPSIRNAILFLEEPRKHLTMLSENHRQFTSKALWDIRYDRDQFEADCFDIFQNFGINASLPINNGTLYSRILYAPEIKILWYPAEKEFSEQLVEHQSSKPKPETGLTNEPPAVEEELLKTKNWRGLIHADSYSVTDQLGYRAYAEVMAAFLTSPLTKPPLTIGIMAPWGKGKTNIMKFIEGRLKQYRPKIQKDTEAEKPEKTTYRKLIDWLKKDTEKIFGINVKDYPVVWFNAWKFQKNEQIWAGLAHEIITQLAEQLEPVEREKFWLRLNLKRVDKDKIKKDIVLKFLQKLFFPAVLAVAGIILGLLLKLFQYPVFQIISPTVSFGGIAIAIGWGLNVVDKLKGKPLEADISKYLYQPAYKDKLGYYTAMEEDLKEALKLLSNETKPPVIFIDDLDRCSPAAITELIEAINLFISGDISSCYFVIGLDAQVVAASLDVTYDKLGLKTANMGKQHGSIGWYFLEKFIQLQFNLPVMQQRQTTRLLNHLFDVQEELSIEEATVRNEIIAIYETIEGEIDTIDDLDQIFTEEKREIEAKIIQFDIALVERFQLKVISRAISSYEIVEDELQAVVENVSAYLSTSPRMIKRFVNLFMFYRFLQYTETCKGVSKADLNVLGDWILIMIRWPQLVRAIQWDNEKDFLHGEDALARAEDLERLISEGADYEGWLKKCSERTQELTWQSDRQLFQFISDREDEELLVTAVESGLW